MHSLTDRIDFFIDDSKFFISKGIYPKEKFGFTLEELKDFVSKPIIKDIIIAKEDQKISFSIKELKEIIGKLKQIIENHEKRTIS